MSDYRLRRANSVSSVYVPRRERPVTFLTRVRSVPSLSVEKYTPPATTTYFPYRRYRDYDLYDDYWLDRHYFYSPLTWPNGYAGRRYYYTDGVSNPYLWYFPSTYSGYTGSWYDYGNPGYYRRFADYLYDRPYRSFVHDSESRSVARGVNLYRHGAITSTALDKYWLSPSYWDRRFRDYRDAYVWDKDYHIPSYYARRVRQYYSY
uniref:Uncharacterized protein n=1 Tax=Plectus sambesii TaxID=2011161 RepID=A0A914VVI6_9BILA